MSPLSSHYIILIVLLPITTIPIFEPFSYCVNQNPEIRTGQLIPLSIFEGYFQCYYFYKSEDLGLLQVSAPYLERFQAVSCNLGFVLQVLSVGKLNLFSEFNSL